MIWWKEQSKGSDLLPKAKEKREEGTKEESEMEKQLKSLMKEVATLKGAQHPGNIGFGPLQATNGLLSRKVQSAWLHQVWCYRGSLHPSDHICGRAWSLWWRCQYEDEFVPKKSYWSYAELVRKAQYKQIRNLVRPGFSLLIAIRFLSPQSCWWVGTGKDEE